MHPRHFRPRTFLWVTLLVTMVASASRSGAQETVRPSAVIVPINGTYRLQMSTKKPIKQVVNPKEAVIGIRPVVGDPTTVLITGQQPDVTTIELTDVDDRKESFEVIVQLDIEYLKTQLRRAVPTANITPIPTSNNSVILTGTVTRAEDVPIILRVANSIGGINIIDALRVGGVMQVQLDVVVAAVNRNTTRSMGFDYLLSTQNFFGGMSTAGAVNTPASTGVGGQFSTFPSLLGIPAANTNVLFGVIHSGWGFLGYLNALRTEGMARVLAQPTLITLSGRPASFLVGGEQAIPVPAGLGQVGVQFEEFGVRLNFLPIVLGNGKIHLEVEPELSQLNAANGVIISGATVPGRDTDRINTTVQMESGQTFVIGGLIRQQSNVNTRKVPILGDMPFVGVFFSQKVSQNIEEELVMLVTPHLIDPQDCSQVLKVLPGQETRLPDDFELFLEGILEAPRGPRQVCRHNHYVPAFKNSPSMEVYPCTTNDGSPCAGGHCAGCANGACGATAPQGPGPGSPGSGPAPGPLPGYGSGYGPGYGGYGGGYGAGGVASPPGPGGVNGGDLSPRIVTPPAPFTAPPTGTQLPLPSAIPGGQ